MPWIKTIPEDKATGDLKRAYEEVLRTRGKISNIMRVQSLNPSALRSFLEFYVNLFFGKSGLTRGEREMIATIISAQNHCDYCVTHHGEALKFHLKNGSQLEDLTSGRQSPDLPPRARALIDYAVKLTAEPGAVVKEDLETLRTVGMSDAEILDVILLTGYMNLVNRIAVGLGVEHDEYESRGYKY